MNRNLRAAIMIGGILIVLIGVMALVMGLGWDSRGYWPGGMMGSIGGGWWIMALMGIFVVLFWGLVIAGIVLLVRAVAGWGGRGPSYQERGDSALEILRQRYARGEISKEEFEAKKKDLL